ncbi:MAG: deoxyribodipyrimidine photo-lyase [Euryarchaeota archaeon]|nr:deoxyribodipyrimidine photo-lyase [Euryarchaeota archaeon]
MHELTDRVRRIKDIRYVKGNVVYWMSREQRIEDNWSLIYAIETARSYGSKLCVAFCLPPEYLGSTIRQYSFMLDGLKEVSDGLRRLGVGFYLLEGYPEIEFPSFLSSVDAGLLITDFDPLDVNRRWKSRVAGEIDIAMHQVDSHNIVPCWKVATRRISTYDTFRKRITPLLALYLVEYPSIEGMDDRWDEDEDRIDWDGALARTVVDKSVPPVRWITPGEASAKKMLSDFCKGRLFSYDARKMNPVESGQSDLSPYIHFGNISAQRIALEVKKVDAPDKEKEGYLEQLIVKKELADNFCLHTPEYDTTGAFPIWARRSLDEHRSDPREHVYSVKELEGAKTHDPLWNAAQTELLKIGKIHGSLRAYWAEKILEWSRRPEDALAAALHLNNKYSLDGNDPAGYTGISMVVGGLYGRPWRTKDVIGKLEKHSYTQERFSYDVHAYYDRVAKL